MVRVKDSSSRSIDAISSSVSRLLELHKDAADHAAAVRSLAQEFLDLAERIETGRIPEKLLIGVYIQMVKDCISGIVPWVKEINYHRTIIPPNAFSSSSTDTLELEELADDQLSDDGDVELSEIQSA